MTDFKKQIGNPKEARKGFDGTLLAYRNSGFKMFQEIADTLDNYKEQILNSFIMIERTWDAPDNDNKMDPADFSKALEEYNF